MTADSLGPALAAASLTLAEAGVASPRADAELLAAHLLGVSRSEVTRRALLGDTPVPTGYADLVAERAARIPLQHLTGQAPFRDLVLAVGPGVFVPRPETEVVAGAAIEEARRAAPAAEPVVVDLCTGSAAIAISAATEVPAARVIGVEVSSDALAWAAANVERLAPGRVDLRRADVSDPPALREVLADVAGRVDVVVSNPPYVPPGQEPLDPEVRDHDPHVALYGGGPDGLAVPRAVIAAAAWLLRPGGLLVMEHADVQGQAAVAALVSAGGWSDVADHPDLAGRPRFVTARRDDSRSVHAGGITAACVAS